MNREERSHVETLVEMMAREAEYLETEVLRLVLARLRGRRETLIPRLERVAAGRVVSALYVRDLMVEAFQAGARYASERAK